VPATSKNRVGAAWSAYLLFTYAPLAARKPAPLSAITSLFSLLPKKCPGESNLPGPESGLAAVEEFQAAGGIEFVVELDGGEVGVGCG
jgi:hypothetical protein